MTTQSTANDQRFASALPRVMVAAPSGHSGKTVVISGIMRALASSGVAVQPFKKGPDYIDPGWHTLACGRPSRNLDSLFMNSDTMRSVLHDASQGSDLAVIEAAMGFYDGSDLQGSSSSAEVAKQTATPVILVIDATRMTRTTAAIVMGMMHFDPDVTIAGVILNRVKGKRHTARIREAIEYYCKIPVVGMVPEDDRLVLPDRHLGLVTGVESDFADDFLAGAAQVMRENVDLGLFVKIAQTAPVLEGTRLAYPTVPAGSDRVKVAVVRDTAFSFYYQENLDALVAAGADLVFANALEDEALPVDIDGLYIGGGFPEVFASQLAANVSFRESVKAAIERGVACVAECGGLMYLGDHIVVDGKPYDMCGVFSLDVQMERERQAHGYSTVTVTDAHPWLEAGCTVVGHEHHHSKVLGIAEGQMFGYENTRGKGTFGKRDGLVFKRTVASYLHANALASPEWALGFVEGARAYHRSHPG